MGEKTIANERAKNVWIESRGVVLDLFRQKKVSDAGRNTNKKHILPHWAPCPARFCTLEGLIISVGIRPKKEDWLEVCYGKVESLSLLSTSLLLPSLPFHHKTGGVFSGKNEIRKAANGTSRRAENGWGMEMNSETLSPVSCFASLMLAAEYIKPIFKEIGEFFSRETKYSIEKTPPDLGIPE